MSAIWNSLTRAVSHVVAAVFSRRSSQRFPGELAVDKNAHRAAFQQLVAGVLLVFVAAYLDIDLMWRPNSCAPLRTASRPGDPNHVPISTKSQRARGLDPVEDPQVNQSP
jgi:hypothetical protein